MANVWALLFTIPFCFAAGKSRPDALPAEDRPIDFLDSRDDPRYEYFKLGNCAVQIPKNKYSDDHIADVIAEKCLEKEDQ